MTSCSLVWFCSWSFPSLSLPAPASLLFSTGGPCAAKLCDALEKGKEHLLLPVNIIQTKALPSFFYLLKNINVPLALCSCSQSQKGIVWYLLLFPTVKSTTQVSHFKRRIFMWYYFTFVSPGYNLPQLLLVWQWLSCSKWTVRQAAKASPMPGPRKTDSVCFDTHSDCCQ